MLYSGVLLFGMYLPVPGFAGVAAGLTALPASSAQGPTMAALALRVGIEADDSHRPVCTMRAFKGDPALAENAIRILLGKNAEDIRKQPAKVLLFMNTGRILESKEPIRHVLDASGRIILDLEPAKIGTRQGTIETEFKDSPIVSVSTWLTSDNLVAKRDSLSLSPKSPGMARICLEGDSGQKEIFDILVLKSALAVQPGGTLPVLFASKISTREIEIEQKQVVSVDVDPAHPTRVILRGLAQGFSSVRLTSGFFTPEFLEVVVHPEKITEKEKVLILSARTHYWLHMTGRKLVASVANSNEKVLYIRPVRDGGDYIEVRALGPGFTRLELTAMDKSQETFAIFVVERK